MSKFKDCLRLTTILVFCGFLSACNQGLADLKQFVQQTISQPPGTIEPIPEFQTYQNVEYTSHDLRDPFKLVDFRRPDENQDAINTITNGPKPNINRVREPLEEFPLDSLRLKGSVTQNRVKWGLVFAPDNTVHRVIKGQYMGQNHGRIISVTDQSIELIEIIPDALGNYIERSSAIALTQ
jgi:type IV pilus assembly protein PilP